MNEQIGILWREKNTDTTTPKYTLSLQKVIADECDLKGFPFCNSQSDMDDVFEVS